MADTSRVPPPDWLQPSLRELKSPSRGVGATPCGVPGCGAPVLDEPDGLGPGVGDVDEPLGAGEGEPLAAGSHVPCMTPTAIHAHFTTAMSAGV